MQAGMAHVSLYTYFGLKAEVFRTLVNEVMDTGLYAPRAPSTPAPPRRSHAERRGSLVAHRGRQPPLLGAVTA